MIQKKVHKSDHYLSLIFCSFLLIEPMLHRTFVHAATTLGWNFGNSFWNLVTGIPRHSI